MPTQNSKPGDFAQKAEQSLGIIPGTKMYSPFPFSGINLQDAPVAIDDKEFSYIENWFRLGNGYLRTAWDVGTALYTAAGGKTLLPYFFFYNIGEIDYCAVFFTDGTAVQVQQSNGAVTPISNAPNTFYHPGGSLPICSQSGTQYLLIANNNTQNDYWIWNGTGLFAAGTIAPQVIVTNTGSNYTSAPTITAYGGQGSGATFTSTIEAGGVVDVQVTNPGSGYELGDMPQLQFSGGGSDTSAILQPHLDNGSVASIEVTNQGSGYTFANVTITGDGTGATATATVTPGFVNTITVTAPGSGYTTATVAFAGGGGSGAAGTATITSGQITSISIDNPGTGYTSAPTITITGDGSGAHATATIGGATVTAITVTNGGTGYTTPPVVTITGDGTGATGAAFLSSGGVAGVTVVDGGTGYRFPPTLSFVGGGGSGATGTVLLTPTSVASVNVAAPGQGYFHTPTVIIDPPTPSGTQATATANIASGQIVSFTLTNAGSGYTRVPEVTIVPDWRDTAGVQAVLVNNQGGGYTSNPTVTLSGGGASIQAIVTATVQNGHVVSYVVQYPGFGYTSNPTVHVSGGGGSGATATAIVQTGASASLVQPAAASVLLVPTSIGSIVMSSEGSGYTSAPAAVLAPGGNNAAAATISTMPFGVSGNALETFNSRVWIAHPFQKTTVPTGGDFSVSAPESLTDFATSDGGVSFTNSDRFLRKHYTAIRQSNGYLYFFGDSSTSVVSNVNTAGNPPTTTFSYQNVDPQVGCAWRDTVQDYGRTIVLGNQIGIFGLYGGTVTPISGKLNKLFNTAIFPPDARAVTPSGAVAHVFDIKHYFMLLTVIDPELGVPRTLMASWNEKEWILESQTVTFTFIGTQEVNSECTAWGTDGKSIYPLFAKPSPHLLKRMTTKVYGTEALFILKDFLNIYLQAQDMSQGAAAGINFTTNFIASGIAVQPFNPNIDFRSVASAQFNSANYSAVLFQEPVFPAPPPFFPVFGTGTGGFSFDSLAVQFATQSPDFQLNNLIIAYQHNTAYQ